MMIKTSIFSKLKIFGILVFLSNPNVINSKLIFLKKWLHYGKTKILNFKIVIWYEDFYAKIKD